MRCGIPDISELFVPPIRPFGNAETECESGMENQDCLVKFLNISKNSWQSSVFMIR
jgi:hypothetical protein